jgi:hypothetical protein
MELNLQNDVWRTLVIDCDGEVFQRRYKRNSEKRKQQDNIAIKESHLFPVELKFIDQSHSHHHKTGSGRNSRAVCVFGSKEGAGMAQSLFTAVLSTFLCLASGAKKDIPVMSIFSLLSPSLIFLPQCEWKSLTGAHYDLKSLILPDQSSPYSIIDGDMSVMSLLLLSLT